MINLHKSLSNLPIIIVINWAICALFFTKNKFYIDNFIFLDYLDTILVFLSLMHSLWLSKVYNSEKKYFINSLICNVFLRMLHKELNTEVYYFLYYLIVSMPFIATLWSLKEKK